MLCPRSSDIVVKPPLVDIVNMSKLYLRLLSLSIFKRGYYRSLANLFIQKLQANKYVCGVEPVACITSRSWSLVLKILSYAIIFKLNINTFYSFYIIYYLN